MNCIQCNSETTNPKFCSRSCAAKRNNQGIARNKPKARFCVKCNAEYYLKTIGIRSIHCPSCRHDPNEIKNRTLAEYHNLPSVKDRHPSWKNSHIRILNRQWNKHLACLPCSNCGYDKHVELCHIKSIASFDDSATLGEVNAESNNVVLCRNCHWEFDNNLLLLAGLSRFEREITG